MDSSKKEKKIEKTELTQNTLNPSVKKKKKWYFLDLNGKVLGRFAVEVSKILRGKEQRDFIYNLDTGGYVVLINSDKLVLTGKEISSKKYYNYSGYPGGMRERTSSIMIKKYSVELVHRVIKGMMPHNSLSNKQLTRLFVYAGSEHVHQAQEKDFLELKIN